MSDQAAGWYPDPTGENQQRYWDGDSWTDYYAPALPAQEEPSGPETAHEDYPYLAEVTHQRPDVMVAPGTPGAWSTSSAWGTPAEGKDDSGTKVFGAGVRNTPGGVAAVASLVVLAVLLVAGIGWWVVSGMRGDDPDPSGGSTGGSGTGSVTTGTVTLTDTIDALVEEDGRWEGTLSLSEATVLLLDVRTDSGEDLEVSVQDSSGAEVAGGDDRGRELTEGLGGSSLDPLVTAELEGGEYTVIVTELDGERSGFTVGATPVVEDVELELPTAASVPASGYWAGSIDLPADGAYAVDVRDSDGNDPVLVTIASDGRVRSNDDRDPQNDDRDPLLETQFPAGTVVLLVTEWSEDATNVTVTVEAS
ncbi:DUF2510 domain-containing protein [Ruania halotolerans]|uniref:DUF2510 domain-containing protein n=1 Tax=Ruania halotolerans TaxID=2897773 RepID=UPI001E4E0BFE|nr:DUF2510 domain-containing protein [Ruania halotolerans]UFU07770.1 DUF2510 domain-containing protein [Ruania halotolerans]